MTRSRRDLERRQRTAREQLYGGIPSPCIGVCRLDDQTNICIGCHRRDDEISSWYQLNDSQRQSILTQAQTRRKSLNLPTPPSPKKKPN